MRTKRWSLAGLAVVLAAGVVAVAQEPRAGRRAESEPRASLTPIGSMRGHQEPAYGLGSQPPGDTAAGPRYQISAWSDASGSRHGAYVIDSQTGAVFLIEGSKEPRFIGDVSRVPQDTARSYYGDPLRTPQFPPRTPQFPPVDEHRR